MFGKKKNRSPDSPILRCSFSKKDQNDVRQVIAGPSVFICDECIELCNDILADDSRFSPPRLPAIAPTPTPAPAASDAATFNAVRFSLCGMPTPVADALLIENRAVLCSGCLDTIQIALAERRVSE